MSPKRSTIDKLQDKAWFLADSYQHPLGSLQGKSLGSYKLVVFVGPKNRIGASYFQIFLRADSDEVSRQPVIVGLHNKGRYPSYNWIEISSFVPRLSFISAGQTLEVAINGLAQQLFQYLADLIPPGGHIMVEYDSPEQQDTARSLALGMPPVVTPLGYMLFSIGCGVSFKNWYFAEGGSEGARKLQGYKALNNEHAQLKAREMVQELMAFLGKPVSSASSELEQAARNRALAVLSTLKHHNAS